jgi:hypothetical protein
MVEWLRVYLTLSSLLWPEAIAALFKTDPVPAGWISYVLTYQCPSNGVSNTH